jgi:hypothetical protein
LCLFAHPKVTAHSAQALTCDAGTRLPVRTPVSSTSTPAASPTHLRE